MFLGVQIIKAQTDNPVQLIIAQMAEDWTENQLSEDEIAMLLEELFSLSENPISINDPNIDQLVEVKLITEFQKNAILKYRKQFGPIRTLSELSMMKEFTSEEIERLEFFVTTEIPEEAPSLLATLKRPKHEILSEYRRNIEKADGYKSKNNEPAAYPGSPDKIYARYRMFKGRVFSAGITMEKDPGEEFFRGSQKQGFDFYSAHAYLKTSRLVDEIAVGDYTVNLGNGMTLGSGFFSGKSSQAVSIRQNNTRIRRYSSATEYNFLRGAATRLKYQNLSMILFASHNNIDANIKQDTLTDEEAYLSTISETGYHRTKTELSYRNQGTETILGGNLTLRAENLRIGTNFYALHYSKPLKRKPELYRLFEPASKDFFNGSIDYQYIYRGFIFWGEAAMDKNTNLAFMQGIHIRTNDVVQIAIHYRDYSEKYYSPKAITFGESDNASNEQGLYLGTLMNPYPNLEINAFADLYRYPWLTYQRYTPAQGYDYMIDAQYKPRRSIRISSRIRFKETTRNLSNDTIPEYIITKEKTTRFHLQADFIFTPYLSSQTRLAITFFENQNTKPNGWLMYHELTWKTLSLPLSISARYVIFNVDSWDARIYTYEKDVLYAFSIPAFSGVGSRYYLVAQWKITPNTALYFKWSQTIYQDVWELSSGDDRIEGNTRSQMALKLKMNF